MAESISNISELIYSFTQRFDLYSKEILLKDLLKSLAYLFDADFSALLIINQHPELVEKYEYNRNSNIEFKIYKNFYTLRGYFKRVLEKACPIISNSVEFSDFGFKSSLLMIPVSNVTDDIVGCAFLIKYNGQFSSQHRKKANDLQKIINSILILTNFTNQRNLLIKGYQNISAADELDDILNYILKSITKIFRCDFVHILVLQSHKKINDSLKIIATTDSKIKKDFIFKRKEGISGWITTNNKFLLVQNLETQVKEYVGITENGERVKILPKSIKMKEIDRCILGVPLRYRENPKGVILIADVNVSNAYNWEYDPKLLQMFADQAAIALENVSLLQRLRDQRNIFLKRMQIAGPGVIALGFIHDIKKLLNNANTHIGSLISFVPINVRNRASISKIIDELIQFMEQVSDIFSNILRYSRKEELNIQEHSIYDIISFVKDLLDFLLDKYDCNVICDPLICKEMRFQCDRNEIEQLFINLFTNSIFALQHIKGRRGQINITIRQHDQEYFKVIFRDNGEGIKQENIPYIFDLFFSTKPKGTGLGLAICKRIVEDNHKGYLQIKSEEGFYTEFVVLLKYKL